MGNQAGWETRQVQQFTSEKIVAHTGEKKIESEVYFSSQDLTS